MNKFNRQFQITKQLSQNLIFCLLFVIVTFFQFQCSDLITEAPPEGESFAEALPGLSPVHAAAFIRGDEAFAEVFTVSTGLGPLFNQPSCESCHPGDGRGSPETVFLRFSKGHDLLKKMGGPQLQDKAIPGVPVENLPTGVDTSPRVAPPVFGMGLIEAIPESALLDIADPNDLDGDGISGRFNMVPDLDGQIVNGRFGRKANNATLLGQIAAAYRDDIGITSDFLPDESLHPLGEGISLGDLVPDPELPSTTVNDVLMYLRLLSPPTRGEITEQVQQGEAIFNDIGCAKCHIPSIKTGPNAIPQLNQVSVNLYSDLLLHFMGYELADNRPDYEANGGEWRTPPLWGLRLAGDPLGGIAFYLHDGRTSDISEAIFLHGGEAELVRNRFTELPDKKRAALVAFLLSL